MMSNNVTGDIVAVLESLSNVSNNDLTTTAPCSGKLSRYWLYWSEAMGNRV